MIMETTITDSTIKSLRGYSYGYTQDEYHVEGISHPTSSFELIIELGFASYDDFFDAFADYLTDCIKEYKQPEFAHWCDGKCCRSLVTELVHKCQEETGELLFSMIIFRLGKASREHKSQMLSLVDEFTFKEGVKNNYKNKITKLIAKKYG